MSTYWWVRCVQCNALSDGGGINRGLHALRAVGELWPRIRGAMSLSSDERLIPVLEVNDRAQELGFILEHEIHSLELQNEYGDSEPLSLKRCWHQWDNMRRCVYCGIDSSIAAERLASEVSP